MTVKNISANRVKQYTALKHKKFRQKYNKFIAEGEKICSSLISFPQWKVESIIVTERFIENLNWYRILADFDAEVLIADEKTLTSLSQLSTAPGIMAVVEIPDFNLESIVNGSAKGFYLDGIKDPGNLGTIVRLADWFGLEYVFCSASCVDVYNSKSVQATMGSMFRIPVFSGTFGEFRQHIQPDWVAVADGRGEPVNTVNFENIRCLVIGSESHGISDEWKTETYLHVSIPGAEERHAESLNAGVAAGILAAYLRGSKNHFL